MTRNQDRALLLAQVLFFLGWGVRALLLDRQHTGGDSFTFQTLSLYTAVAQGGLSDIFPWMSGMGYKGPLAPLLALPLVGATGQMLLGTRLVSLLAHGVALVQTHALARQVSGQPAAGQWAVLLLGTNQMVFGWTRMDFQESLLTTLLLTLLLLLLRVRFTRARHGLLLGSLLGLGLLTKLGFLVFAVAPGCWLLARRLRDRRTLLPLFLAAPVAAAISAPWVVPNADWIYRSFFMVAHTAEHLLADTAAYLGEPSTWGLLLAAAAGAALLIWMRPTGRWPVALLVIFILGAVGLFITLFEFWARYLMPIYPPAAALAGAGLAYLMSRRRKWLTWPAGALLALGLLVTFVQANMAEVTGWHQRDFTAGMISPDRRPFDGFARVIRRLLPHGGEIRIIVDGTFPPNRLEGAPELWHFRGLRFRALSMDQAKKRLAWGETIPVMLVTEARNHADPEAAVRGTCPASESELASAPWNKERRWLGRLGHRCLLGVVDPDRVVYSGYLVSKPREEN